MYLNWPEDPGYKKKCISEQNKSIRKKGKKMYQRESTLEKKMGLGIVVVRISWHGHPGYKKNRNGD